MPATSSLVARALSNAVCLFYLLTLVHHETDNFFKGNSVQQADSSAAQSLLGLLGLLSIVGDLTASIGISCSPLLGGSTSWFVYSAYLRCTPNLFFCVFSSSQTVCCQNNNFSECLFSCSLHVVNPACRRSHKYWLHPDQHWPLKDGNSVCDSSLDGVEENRGFHVPSR